MATNAVRAKAIIDALTDIDTPNAQILRIVNGAVAYQAGAEDPEPSNDELAGRFVQAIIRVVRANVRAVAEAKEAATYQAAIKAAGDTAEADI